MISLPSVDKICTDYSWWTLDGLWMVKAPAKFDFVWMSIHILGGFSGPIVVHYS